VLVGHLQELLQGDEAVLLTSQVVNHLHAVEHPHSFEPACKTSE
jgi:hypothetical protein